MTQMSELSDYDSQEAIIKWFQWALRTWQRQMKKKIKSQQRNRVSAKNEDTKNQTGNFETAKCNNPN